MDGWIQSFIPNVHCTLIGIVLIPKPLPTFLCFIFLLFFSGSPVECVYALESFGISSKQNPLNMATGKIDLTYHLKWLRLCVAREETPKKLKMIIECPNHSDILSGRGQIVMNHPGNSMFRDFIHSNLELYLSISSKKESTQWTWSVVRKLKSEYGARFLKEQTVCGNLKVWVEVTNEVARSKVRIAFRDARSRQLKSMGNDAKGALIPNSMKTIGVKDANLIQPRVTLSKLPSKRKTENITPPNSTIPLSASLQHTLQQQPQHFNHIDNDLNTLNLNISQLNTNLNTLIYQQQVTTRSGTLGFSGLNGSDSSKRQRFDSQNSCFDCFS